ncbi:IS110 family transposase [Nonomuraea polychroma]|uniref:IS110 family transposase n=1 Tax=Nonomuraea polychroma TaxID=46176 RepID=UPI003D8D1A46
MSLALPQALMFVGVDWAVDEHAVCVMDPSGEVVTGFMIEHSADGIARLVHRLAKYGPAGQLPIAIERPNGRLVDLLLEAGHPVVPVKPNAIRAIQRRQWHLRMGDPITTGIQRYVEVKAQCRSPFLGSASAVAAASGGLMAAPPL